VSAVALPLSRPTANAPVRSWVGICSLLTAPIFACLAFVLTYSMRGDVHSLILGRLVFESILSITLALLVVFLGMALWQWAWAVRLIRDSFKADPRRGYLLLSLLLFTTALVSLLAVSMLHPTNLAQSASALMLAWMPAALAALGSAVAMSRARANAFLWLGYLLFIPLIDVTVDTLSPGGLCGPHMGAHINVVFLAPVQAPWVMVGFAMVAVTIIVASVRALRSGAIDGWLAVHAASVGLPLSTFALLVLGAWASYSGLAGCGGEHFDNLHALRHLFGAFYL